MTVRKRGVGVTEITLGKRGSGVTVGKRGGECDW